mgnify:CR=1 FL=1
MQISDGFEKMEAAARKILFTPSQRAIGREYGALFQKLDAAGVRCSSVEALRQNSGGHGGEYIDALLQDRARLEGWQRRIGSGVALEVRRQRPSSRNKRGLIGCRRLVDMVCVGEMTLAEVLEKCGWVAPGRAG